MATVTIHSDFRRQESTVSTFPPSICHEMIGPDAMIFIFFFKRSALSLFYPLLPLLPSFTLFYPLLPSSKGYLVLFYFLSLERYQLCITWGWYFCSNLNSYLWFIQTSISHDALCIQLNKQNDNIQPYCT